MAAGPKAHVDTALGAAEFYLNKILSGAKDMADPEKTNHREFVAQTKKLAAALAEYVQEWHKSGIIWKHNGAKLSEYKAGQSSAKAAGGSKSVEDRLDALASRLERLAAKKGGGDGESPAVAEYKAFHEAKVAPFLTALGKFTELKQLSDWTSKGYACLGRVILAASQSKKPTDQELLTFAADINKVVGDSANVNNKSLFFNHEKAFNETITALAWILQPGPKAFIESQLGAAEFYFNKILIAAKTKEDPEKTNHQNFVKLQKELLNGLAEYCQEHHKMGLSWNPKGKDLKDFK